MNRPQDIFGAAPKTVLNKPFLHVQGPITGSGNVSGTVINGENLRNLNDVKHNDISGATVSGGIITLPAGTYHIKGWSQGYNMNNQYYYHKLYLRDGVGTLIAAGTGWYSYSNAANTQFAVALEVNCQVTFATSTQVKMYHQVNGTIASLTSAVGAVYSSELEIWQLDATSKTPVLVNDKLYPLPGGAMVTGNMHGLEYAYTSTSTVTVQPGICMDSLNTTLLSLSSAQVVTIGSVINTIYNLFLCDDGVVRTDTDVDGAALSAYKFRWIGFVRTTATGEISLFTMNGDFVHNSARDGNEVITGVSTSYTAYDHSHLFPINRIELIEYGVNATNTTVGFVLASIDGVNTEFYVGYNNFRASTDTSAWADGGLQKGGLKPFVAGRLFKSTITTNRILCQALKLKR